MAAAVLLAVSSVPMIAGNAAGEESLSELKARMGDLQAELDAAAGRIEALEAQHHEVTERMEHAQERIEALNKRNSALTREAIKRADALYRSGGTQMVEVLFGSANFTELTDRAEMLSQVSLDDSAVFVRLARSKAELERLSEELAADKQRLASTEEALQQEASELQSRFQAVSGEYEALRKELAAVAPAPAAPASTPRVLASGGMACPIAGPNSFIDSWGAPRAGHTHQGVDMMAAYGTPVVAITSGTITLSSYGSSAGYWQILSGDDGNSYWYMHNQQNLVNGGHVQAGQQIATVGDTGNAEGTPHLHFEYHPGGGSAVNPYPLVASIC